MKRTVSRKTLWRSVFWLLAGVVVLVPTLWFSARNVDALNSVNHWVTFALYYFGTPAQGIYVLLYLTRPWRKYGPTRAVMNKSFSLFLIMLNSLIVLQMFGQRPLEWPWWLLLFRIVSGLYLLAAIYYQLFVNVREIRAGYRDWLSPDVTKG